MFKSKAQAKKIAKLVALDKFPFSTFKEWANGTKNYDKLPEHTKRK